MTKNILITGKTSYIGNQLADWLAKESEKYKTTKISVRDDKWKKYDFSCYDTVVHVAGIAHQDTKADQEELYYKINTDLTIELAKKAKSEGVKQFIFMSSMIVYGASSKIGEQKLITKDTIPEPINFYGNSKLLAEENILPLQTNTFNVVAIRPPMIYGKGSKGNYSLLSKAAQKLVIFPDIDNKRSMLHVDNLTEFIKLMIVNEEKGVFFPQNEQYVKTSELVLTISDIYNKRIKLVKIFNPLLRVMSKKINIVNKIFGNLSYDLELSKYKENYRVRDMAESIKVTERY